MLAIALAVVFFIYILSRLFTVRVPKGYVYVGKSRLPFGLYKRVYCLSPGLHYRIPLYHSLVKNIKTKSPISIPESIKDGDIIAGRTIGLPNQRETGDHHQIQVSITYAISTTREKYTLLDKYMEKSGNAEDLFAQIDRALLEMIETHFSGKDIEKSPNKWINGYLTNWFQNLGLTLHIHTLTVSKVSKIF